MALLIGSLFRASADTGARIMNMFATIGIFLFGVVGTLALTRWQSNNGVKDVHAALKALEPEWVITDWAAQGGGKPDYLLVGPGGIVCVCVDETPQSTWATFARKRIARGRERVQAAERWVQGRLTESLPVSSVLLLTRRRAQEEYTADGVTVLNPPTLGELVAPMGAKLILDQRERFDLTRKLRSV
ncbi:MAG: hypothetical protein K0R39_1823 [Symbiobacteriaceae bacterium]|nr:hypothetical protein [Symbiobacteriaceae bacterium]